MSVGRQRTIFFFNPTTTYDAEQSVCWIVLIISHFKAALTTFVGKGVDAQTNFSTFVTRRLRKGEKAYNFVLLQCRKFVRYLQTLEVGTVAAHARWQQC